MERRNFLRAMLGVAAATALPSEVWPFRKIFLPPMIVQPTMVQICQARFDTAAQEITDDLNAIELEYFSKRLPQLVFAHRNIWNLFKESRIVLGDITPVGLISNVV